MSDPLRPSYRDALPKFSLTLMKEHDGETNQNEYSVLAWDQPITSVQVRSVSADGDDRAVVVTLVTRARAAVLPIQSDYRVGDPLHDNNRQSGELQTRSFSFK